MYTATGTIDVSARVVEYAPMVRRMAHHLAAKLPASVQIDDMVQAGMIGLMDAASRYEAGHNCSFETFASQRIRGAMLDELRAADWLPRSVRKALRRIESAIAKLQQKLGRPPTEREIAEALGLSIGEYHAELREARGYEVLHFEDFGPDGGDDFLDRHCTDAHEDPLEKVRDAGFRRALVAAIERLPERERLLMGLYYEQELNFKEIASVLEVTESRVCQLHAQAVARLRAVLRDW
ncbi:MAG: RNA polymerase sigma factor FliA [Burkholderiales bacterium]|nr:RNA polymerase sigma factor FliA [Burkholderiales bacterium]MCE7876471.1 RNA polymerase sigma factor FliA [Betaproteobacteria bacterium PRO3]